MHLSRETKKQINHKSITESLNSDLSVLSENLWWLLPVLSSTVFHPQFRAFHNITLAWWLTLLPKFVSLLIKPSPSLSPWPGLLPFNAYLWKCLQIQPLQLCHQLNPRALKVQYPAIQIIGYTHTARLLYRIYVNTWIWY